MHEAPQQKPSSSSSPTTSAADPSSDPSAADRAPDSGTERQDKPKGANSLRATSKHAPAAGDDSFPAAPKDRPRPGLGVEAMPGQQKSHDDGTANPTPPKSGLRATAKKSTS